MPSGQWKQRQGLLREAHGGSLKSCEKAIASRPKKSEGPCVALKQRRAKNIVYGITHIYCQQGGQALQSNSKKPWCNACNASSSSPPNHGPNHPRAFPSQKVKQREKTERGQHRATRANQISCKKAKQQCSATQGNLHQPTAMQIIPLQSCGGRELLQLPHLYTVAAYAD